MTTAARPTLGSVLEVVTRERLVDLGRVTGTGLTDTRGNKRDLVNLLTAAVGEPRLPSVLRELGRDELRAVSRAAARPGGLAAARCQAHRGVRSVAELARHASPPPFDVLKAPSLAGRAAAPRGLPSP